MFTKSITTIVCVLSILVASDRAQAADNDKFVPSGDPRRRSNDVLKLRSLHGGVGVTLSPKLLEGLGHQRRANSAAGVDRARWFPSKWR